MLKSLLKKFRLVLPVLIYAATAHTADFAVGHNNDTDTVYFNSTARLEFIEGRTGNIEGCFNFEPDNSNAPVSGILRVDLRTLKSGIDTRDEHMRDNHLHTDKYPFAYFELMSVESLESVTTMDSIYSAKARGRFYIHGHYRDIEPELEIVRKKSAPGVELINIRAKFSINLDKFKIPRPKALFLKLAETIEVEVIFSGSTTKSPILIELPDWSKLD